MTDEPVKPESAGQDEPDVETPLSDDVVIDPVGQSDEESVTEDAVLPDAEQPESEDIAESASESEPTEIETLQGELDTYKDKLLRSYADLENFKRRKAQEMIEVKKYSAEQFVNTILPVLDSFDRACDHAYDEESNKKEVVDGFMLIQKQFHDALEKIGVTAIEATGQPFDPHSHQAVMQEDSAEHEADTVIKEMQKGYRLHDRVIRPAMVVVSK